MDNDQHFISERMPNFNNHEEAREWFKEQFDNKFLFRSINEDEGKKTFFYHIVKNPEVYNQYMRNFASPFEHEITNMKTFESYTTVEINEDGEVNFTI
ncbi:hypothetical protein [Fredinandcohnia quinoae]|uniref:Uncharacterized protein n=1 Tax=Fredinandcohnia quinoae TaxID=2918902 RepID=A0AAW5E2L5_9BACI|nr:hypothetical protein [Fredinandcohnia sp. SECRCQ15]MCH1627135.1 hypothetical protein [Fredinandcohnia sp. SECRCQ15]